MDELLARLKDQPSWAANDKTALLTQIATLVEELKEKKVEAERLNAQIKSSAEQADNVQPKVEATTSSTADNKQQIVYVQPEKSYRLDPNTPVYGGSKGENLHRWIILVDNAMKAIGVPEQKKLCTITNYVKDKALDCLISYLDNTYAFQQTFQDFCKRLAKMENLADREFEVQCKLARLRQTNSFEDYLHQFESLALGFSISVKVLIGFFIAGLKPRIGIEVRLKEPKTLEEAYTIASYFDRGLRETSSQNVNFAKSHGDKGHYNKTKSLNNRNNNNNNGNKSNYNKSNNNNTNNNNKSNNQKSNNAKEKKVIKCFKCKREGHKIADCHAKTTVDGQQLKSNLCKDDNDQLLMINGFINNKPIDYIVFDIGATTSIMSLAIAEKYNFPIEEANVELKFANQQVVKAVGKTVMLTIVIRGHKCQLKFIVMKGMEYDILLGIDYFNKTGLGIVPKTRK